MFEEIMFSKMFNNEFVEEEKFFDFIKKLNNLSDEERATLEQKVYDIFDFVENIKPKLNVETLNYALSSFYTRFGYALGCDDGDMFNLTVSVDKFVINHVKGNSETVKFEDVVNFVIDENKFRVETKDGKTFIFTLFNISNLK